MQKNHSNDCIIALIQVASIASVEQQLERVEYYLAKAQQAKAQLVVLPEEFLTLHLSPVEKLSLQETFEKGPLQQKIKQLAQKYKLWIVAGTLPIKSENKERFYSSCLVFNPEGEIKARYDKIHLFDVEIEGGKETYLESAYVVPGNNIVTLKLPFAHIGLAICYDLRFPELFRAMVNHGTDIFILPSAFTIRTGEKHWETLIKARAIENLSFFLACNHVGLRKNGEGTYGHSMVIDPWGEKIDGLIQSEGMVVASLDLKSLRQLRQKFPALSHQQKFISI
ncbi:carbon-nitrogen hydrolase family protein [Candidatus Berkiella cookevillensis]|uniref:2-oxoglutaramate amidase n=1 Tax=Candidatus Berkiella cookevillensis TaxID=437022 RepID=A0A0Q9YJN4_9GAMM|nr:carbon-nitrogen hydrolase family protein [Candidatus Berkiella cookevillensis]MCS5709020.1 carbon-nitrogen hydrolase family protein [Candidatus Berkiella cookevillensis]